jgi:GLPGLI family protein
MRKLILFAFLIFILSCDYCFVILSAETVVKRNNFEILDSALFRVVYKVDIQALKENDPFTVTDTMALDIGNTWSVYYDLYRHYKDSVYNYNHLNNSPREIFILSSNREELNKRLETRQEIYEMSDKRKNGESARIYKNRKKNEIMTIDDGPLEGVDTHTLFRFTENIKPMEWIITEDTLTVLNYLCQKATTSFRGRNYTAWFNIEIPINEGPWKLYGLPGIIMKVEDSDNTYCFQAIGLQDLKNRQIEINNETKFLYRGSQISIVRKYIGGTLKQWQAYRRAEYRKVIMSFLDPDAISSYNVNNPVIYPEIEVEF